METARKAADEWQKRLPSTAPPIKRERIGGRSDHRSDTSLDNLYAIGRRHIVFALQTSAGIILIDSVSE